MGLRDFFKVADLAIFLSYLPVISAVGYAAQKLAPLLAFPGVSIYILPWITFVACGRGVKLLPLIGGLAAVLAIYFALLSAVKAALQRTGFFQKHKVLLYCLLFIAAYLLIGFLMAGYSATAFSLLHCYWS